MILRHRPRRVSAHVCPTEPCLLPEPDWLRVGRDRRRLRGDRRARFPGPAVREPSFEALAPEVAEIDYFHVTEAKIGDAPVTISRTGFTGDLGYEIWIEAADAVTTWDRLMEASEGHGVLPFGQIALLMARIEAGLLLLKADFESSRFAWNDDHRSTPIELGFGWMFRDIETENRSFIGRQAIRQELSTRRAAAGSWWGWWWTGRNTTTKYNSAGLVPPKDHTPDHRGVHALYRRLPVESDMPPASCTHRSCNVTSQSPGSSPSFRPLAPGSTSK